MTKKAKPTIMISPHEARTLDCLTFCEGFEWPDSLTLRDLLDVCIRIKVAAESGAHPEWQDYFDLLTIMDSIIPTEEVAS